MIPLYFFLIAWLVFLGLYGVMALVSLFQFIRFGVAGIGTWLSSLTFIAVVTVVILGTGSVLVGVDWHQSLNLFAWIGSSPILPQ